MTNLNLLMDFSVVSKVCVDLLIHICKVFFKKYSHELNKYVRCVYIFKFSSYFQKFLQKGDTNLYS